MTGLEALAALTEAGIPMDVAVALVLALDGEVLAPDAEQPPEGGCAETVAAYRWADPDTGT